MHYTLIVFLDISLSRTLGSSDDALELVFEESTRIFPAKFIIYSESPAGCSILKIKIAIVPALLSVDFNAFHAVRFKL